MKSFIAVTFLFIILVALIFANASFINSTAKELLQKAETIPDAKSAHCKYELKVFESSWNEFKKAASFTVSYTELSKISCLIEELHVHLSNNNVVDFDHTLAVMINSLREIPRFECLSIDTIF